MKFSDYGTVVHHHPNGSRFVKEGMMVVPDAQPCIICKSLTRYLDVCSEAHFCSDECLEVFNKMVAEQENNGILL